MSVSFVEEACRQTKARFNNSVYNPLLVMWLLMQQRLCGAASLETTVLDLLQYLPVCFWPNPCKRVRDWQNCGKPVSGNTAAYNQARQRLPLTLVEQSCDRIFDQLMACMAPEGVIGAPRHFLLDGSSIRLAHSPALIKRFAPSSNQHGENHWPVIRVLVAHDLQTGLAMRPQWGPMYGPHAVSEQQLLKDSIDRLPAGSTVIGDCNFGVFSVAWAAAQREHAIVLRLTLTRARHLFGETLKDGTDCPYEWIPSRHDRKLHPDVPPDACVQGRLIVRQVQPDDGTAPVLLALFTTRPESVEEILDIYGQRWNIETDLRTLKSQLGMEQLSCATPEMVAKEIDMAFAAYNLVRAAMCMAARQSGLRPRQYSFTRSARIVASFAPQISSAANEQEAKCHSERMMYFLQQARLPRRKRTSYPRAVWGIRKQYPRRK